VADPIRVLIADDHPVVRQGLRTYLEERGAVAHSEACVIYRLGARGQR